jgi:hypothetical protein
MFTLARTGMHIFAGLSYIPAPKPKLPGHAESYNPSEEYVPTAEERQAYDMMEDHERPKFIPQSFDAMRQVGRLAGTNSDTLRGVSASPKVSCRSFRWRITPINDAS